MSLKSLFSVKDMTEGVPWKRIMEFAVPMIIGNIAQQLYNTADSVIVGRYVGDNALAAVGSASPILNLLLAVFVGLATGASITISQSFGAKDREGLSRYIGNCITLAGIATLIIMVIGPLITMPMLRLLNTPSSIIDWCASYLNIYFIGIAGFFFYNMFSAILRGMGDSFSALLFLLVAAALNVGLDILFVARYKMGVAGVSLATVIAQGISAIMCLIKLSGMRDVFDLNFETLKLKRAYFENIIRIGLPSGVTQGIMSISMLVVQSLTNSLGELVIACSVIIMRVDGFAMMPNMSFGNAMSVYTGQNVGAGKLDRVSSGVKQGSILALTFSGVVTVILLFFGHYLFAIFTNTAELIDLAVRMMRILAAGYLCVAISQCLGGTMRGAGDTVTPMWISIITTIGLRIPVAYGLAALTKSSAYPNGRPEALYISLLVSWSMGAIISFIAFKMGKWRSKIKSTSGVGSCVREEELYA
ncbi:MATE family efflux transporter [Lutispora thermophila]|uniref:Probable multidrug resistance protein NorM n=1 Tax=Lutispora thermophila DSM 19022 TaxID=1122184 RepID=A0A1M6GXB2_9FIRM|nr:MATE family efflux transporter [Lutispora thermophila]SHJ14485.1 putative efflux protein, MATE family [Lutispora thermophila DSM 19022]